ncbi:MAG: hypothetical protein ACOX8S_07495 [Christensenellales bacterium]|jgi:ATP-binding cassette subfamily B protein
MQLFQQCTAYAYFTMQVIGSHITIGDFSMYIGGVTAFSGAMRGLMSNIVEVRQYRSYYNAIDEHLNIPAKMRDNKHLPLPSKPYCIEFRNVSFQYPGQENYALKDINITLREGCKLSVVGAGETTFVKLLCRI